MQDDRLLTASSKTDFSDIYTRPDPRRFYQVLAGLDYQIPQSALPVFRAVLAASRGEERDRTVLDVCCSYGINSALLYAPHPEQVLARYTGRDVAALSPAELAEDDRRYYASRRGNPAVLGLDASAEAIAYATRAGLLTAGWAENLESADPSPGLAAGIAEAGLIISTGGVGYVGRRTFERLLRSLRNPRDVWLAVFVLRVFDYAEIADLLREYGLVTEKLGMTFRQRRFANDEERRAAVQDVSRRGLDPAGKELDGWYHAECFLTRPADAARTPVTTLLGPVLRKVAG